MHLGGSVLLLHSAQLTLPTITKRLLLYCCCTEAAFCLTLVLYALWKDNQFLPDQARTPDVIVFFILLSLNIALSFFMSTCVLPVYAIVSVTDTDAFVAAGEFAERDMRYVLGTQTYALCRVHCCSEHTPLSFTKWPDHCLQFMPLGSLIRSSFPRSSTAGKKFRSTVLLYSASACVIHITCKCKPCTRGPDRTFQLQQSIRSLGLQLGHS